MSDRDWTRPQAMVVPKKGYVSPEMGRYGPIYPRPPACHGFTIISKIKPGTKEEIRSFIYQVRPRTQCSSFLEYGEYPYITAGEIMKVL